MRLSRRSLLAGTAALGLPSVARAQEKVVRYGIYMTDIPLTTGQPDRGAYAYVYTGHTIYDPLVAWELDVTDRPGKMIPGLATEWKVSDADKTVWVFKLRPGIRWQCSPARAGGPPRCCCPAPGSRPTCWSAGTRWRTPSLPPTGCCWLPSA